MGTLGLVCSTGSFQASASLVPHCRDVIVIVLLHKDLLVLVAIAKAAFMSTVNGSICA